MAGGRWRCLQYWLRRSRLNLALLEQLDLIGRTAELARAFGIDFFSVLSRGSQYRVESMMVRLAHTQNYLMLSPAKEQVVPLPCLRHRSNIDMSTSLFSHCQDSAVLEVSCSLCDAPISLSVSDLSLGQVCASVHLSVRLSACLPVCLSVCPSVCVYLSVYLSVCLSVSHPAQSVGHMPCCTCSVD